MRKTLLLVILTMFVGLTSIPAQAQQAPGGQTLAAAHVAPDEAPPESFVLSPAYPNPFETTTQFTVTTQERQHIRVEVFNMLGRRVKTLFDDVLPADTPRTFTLKAGDLPSGLYLYRATGSEGAATRQVTLLQ